MASSRSWLVLAAIVVMLLATMSAQQATSPAVVLLRIEPFYPPIAASARVRGTVTVRVGVRPDGSIAETTLLDGVSLLNDGALTAASRASFECRGCTEPSTPHTIRFVFSLDRHDSCGNAPPPEWKQAGDASSDVTVFGDVFMLSPPYKYVRFRAARCLWLWRCSKPFAVSIC